MRSATKPADKKTLHELVPLDALSEARFAEIAKKITIEEVRKGRYLFRQGDRDGYSMYLLEGKINLIDGHRKVVGEIEAGTDASRYPIANQQPRPASARAVTRVVIAHIDSGLLDVFLTWDQTSSTEVSEIKADDDQDWMTRMLQSDVFARIPPAIIQRLLMRMESCSVHAGEVIISQGDVGDYFYTIDMGRCAVSRKSSPEAEDVKLAELSDGDFFGEAALVSESRRNATVTMLTDGLLMRLAKRDFVELLRDQLVQTISFDEAVEMVNEGAVWLDVRSPGEFETGSFEDSVNIPLSDLHGEMPELVFNVKYIICCDTARRSASAAFILSHKGFDVYVLDGGLNGLDSGLPAQDGLPAQADSVVQETGGSAIEQDADVIRFARHAETRTQAVFPSSGEDTQEAVSNADAPADKPAIADEAGQDDRLHMAQQMELDALRQENQRLGQELNSHQLRENELSGRLAGLEQLEQDFQTSQTKLASLQRQLDSGSEEGQLLRVQYTALQKEYTDRIGLLEQELSQSRTLLESLQADLDAGKQERQRLEAKLDSGQHDRQAEITHLEAELVQAREQMERLQAELAGANEQAVQLRNDAESSGQEQQGLIAELRDELQQSWRRTEALQEEVESVRVEKQAAQEAAAALEAQGDDALAHLQAELAEAREQAEGLQAELAGANERAALLRDDAESSVLEREQVLEQLHSELSGLRTEKDGLGRQLDEEHDKTAGLQQQLDELAARLEEEREHSRSSVEQLQREVETATADKKELERQLASLQQERKEDRDKLAMIAAENQDVHSSLQQLRDEHNVLQEEKRQLKLQQEEQMANIAQDRQAAEESRDRLQQEWMAERDSARVELEEKDTQLKELQARLEQSQEVHDTLQQRLEELQSGITKGNEQTEQNELRYAELQQEHARIADEYHAMIAERDGLQGRVTEAQQNQAALQEEIETLNARIISLTETSDATVSALKEQLQDAQVRTSKADRQIDEQTVQIESLEQKLAESREEIIRLEVETQSLQEKVEELQREFRQMDEGARAFEQQNQNALDKAFEDLTRKNDTEKELQGQIERLRKKLEQTGEELLEAHKEVRENTERFREELNSERRARAEERAQLAARQKELKEQLAAFANQHEGGFSTPEGAYAQAEDAVREEEQSRLREALSARDQAEEQITALRNELTQSHEETARAVQQERERYQADLALVRDQKTEADENVARIEAQLGQLMQERDTALAEHQDLREQLNSLRAEMKVARGLTGSEGDIRIVDPVQMQAELEEARKNVKIAIRLRTEAEAQRDKAVREAVELKRQYQTAAPAEGPLHVPVLDEADEKNQPVATQSPPPVVIDSVTPGAKTGTRRPVFKYVVEWGNGAKLAWLGKAIGFGLTGIAALLLWQMLKTDNPIGPAIQDLVKDLGIQALVVPDIPADGAASAEAAVTGNPEVIEAKQHSANADAVRDSLVVAEEISAQDSNIPEDRETRGAIDAQAVPDVPAVAAGRSFRDTLESGGKGPVMVELPAASYLMGSPGNSLDFEERPQHRVDLGTFSISKDEVSFAEYDRFARATGRRLPRDEGWGRGNQPVVNVSWKDANAYVRWLSRQTGHTYRLPTESEWEFAARAGTTRDHWWEPDTNPVPANCFDCGSSWDGKRPAAVGSFPANAFGLHDTAGNVQEWTEDCYFPNYKDATRDGSARQGRRCSQRVVRGGSYNSPLDSLRSAKRGQYDQETRLDNLGFRVVRTE
ncbi:MAG: SUMF1/EgtB/PvdO family nonheme iron enzyme [Gammaproteobacteria bacterium]|jgi:formylglycine-generating enzyme required for sulfatase activity/CRP-like cAMP-binding protein